MKKVFLDSDVILDALLERTEFYLPAANIISLAYQNKLRIVTSSVAFVNVNYFLDKFDRANKFSLLNGFRSIISVLTVDEVIIDLALKSGVKDFEDAVQYYSALNGNCDVIITRNLKDYKHSAIPVLTADQFLRQL